MFHQSVRSFPPTITDLFPISTLKSRRAYVGTESVIELKRRISAVSGDDCIEELMLCALMHYNNTTKVIGLWSIQRLIYLRVTTGSNLLLTTVQHHQLMLVINATAHPIKWRHAVNISGICKNWDEVLSFWDHAVYTSYLLFHLCRIISAFSKRNKHNIMHFLFSQQTKDSQCLI